MSTGHTTYLTSRPSSEFGRDMSGRKRIEWHARCTCGWDGESFTIVQSRANSEAVGHRREQGPLALTGQLSPCDEHPLDPTRPMEETVAGMLICRRCSFPPYLTTWYHGRRDGFLDTGWLYPSPTFTAGLGYILLTPDWEVAAEFARSALGQGAPKVLTVEPWSVEPDFGTQNQVAGFLYRSGYAVKVIGVEHVE